MNNRPYFIIYSYVMWLYLCILLDDHPKYFVMVSWPQSESNMYLSLLQLSVRHKSPPEHRRLIDYLGAIRHFSKLIVGWLQCCQNLGVQIATWQHWLIVAISQIRSPLSRLFAIVAHKLRLRERWWRSHYVIQQWKSKKIKPMRRPTSSKSRRVNNSVANDWGTSTKLAFEIHNLKKNWSLYRFF